MVSDFQDYCHSNLENENTLAIEMRTHFIKSSTERVFFKFVFYSYY